MFQIEEPKGIPWRMPRPLLQCPLDGEQWIITVVTQMQLWVHYTKRVTYLPLMTPSGLSIGMILNTKFSRKSVATGSLLTRNSKVPFITQLPLLSPG